MKKSIQKVDKLAKNPWFVIAGTVITIITFVWYVYDRITLNQPTLSLFILVISIIFLSIGMFYSLKVREENFVLQQIASIFNEINYIYRDSLKNMFWGDSPIENPSDLLVEEEKVLRGICQRIEKIYSQLIKKDCLVTIKLVIEESGKSFAHTYVRSLENCTRDNPRIKYAVNTGENTAFDTAMKQLPNEPDHFYSPDLTKEENYSNARVNYDKLYRSTIIVPIRGINKGKEGTNKEFDMIGFLCIDTKSINRLKKGYQIQIASALAGQMYNFMSLMRGKYTVFVCKK